MGVLNIKDLKAGMILDQPIINKHGALLLDGGRELTDKHIEIFKTWGITEADIQGVDQEQLENEEMNTLPEHVLESIEHDLKNYFVDFENNKVMKEIYRITRKFKVNAERTQGKQGNYDSDKNI